VATGEPLSRDMPETEKTASDEQLAGTTLPSNETLVVEEEQETFASPSFTPLQEILLIAILLFALTGAILRYLAIRKWQNKV